MIAELDSNLHEGQELREIYEEIMKTLPTKHLEFTSVSSHTSPDTHTGCNKMTYFCGNESKIAKMWTHR